jgi:hypothetical protein
VYEQYELSPCLNGLDTSVRQVADECAGIIETMLGDIKKYKDSLEPGSSGNCRVDAYKKFRFSMMREDHIEKLRERLRFNTHCLQLLTTVAAQ